MQKNVDNQLWRVYAFDSTDNTPVTGDGTNITGNLYLDGGGANPIDDTNPTEIANGYYTFDITQAESNADNILISAESSTENVIVIGSPTSLYTRPPNFEALGIQSNGDLTTVTTLSGHTAQTGDNFTLLGTAVALDGGAATIGGMLTKIADDNDGGDFDATFDSLNKLQAAIITGAPVNNAATGQNITNGTVDSGSYVNTAVSDDVFFQLSPNGSVIDVDLIFDIGTDKPAEIAINGYWNGAGNFTNIYAWDYIGTVWEQLSDASTRMNNAVSKQDYMYILLSRHANSSGEAKVRFLSSSTNAAHDLYIDQLLVQSIAIGFTPAEIAEGVWTHNVEEHSNHVQAGFMVRNSFIKEYGVTTQDTAISFTCSDLPAIADYYNGHKIRIHDVTNSRFADGIITDMDNVGIVTLTQALPFTPDTASEMYVYEKVDDGRIDSIKTTVDTNLNATVSSRAIPGDEMALIDAAITGAKFNASTAFPTTSVDTGITRIARTGADVDTLETLSVQSDGIATDIGNLNDFDPTSDTVANVTVVAILSGHTAQTGDNYAIVNHGTYGNAFLVRSTVPANTLDVSLTGEAGLDFANIKNATGAHTLTNITIPITTSVTNAVVTDAASRTASQANVSALALEDTSLGISGIVAAIKVKTDPLQFYNTNYIQSRIDYIGTNIVTTPDDFKATGFSTFNPVTTPVEILATGGTAGKNAEELVDDFSDEPLTAGAHNVPTSLGRRIRELASNAIHAGTCGSGSTGISVVFDIDAEDYDGAYDPAGVSIVEGTGTGQTRLIYEYVGAERRGYVNRTWKMTPDITSRFVIFGHPGGLHTNEGLVRGGGVNYVLLNSLAPANDGDLEGQTVVLRAGTGEDQSGIIIEYIGAEQKAIISKNWTGDIPVDGETVYVIVPMSLSQIDEIRDAILEDSHRLMGRILL